MAAKVVTLCDEVRTLLDAVTFSQTNTVERHNVWFRDASNVSGLMIIVVPVDVQTSVETRSGASQVVRLAVIVEKWMADPNSKTEQDALIQVSEEVVTALLAAAYTSGKLMDTSEQGPQTTIDADKLPTETVSIASKPFRASTRTARKCSRDQS